MIPTSGRIFYDGVDITTMNLDALRKNITIIPQQPELMTGTLRQNLDPFEEHDDALLNACLRSSGLVALQEDEDSKISLDSVVSTGGSNFSLGQRQIIALARAMVRRSKVYILGVCLSTSLDGLIVDIVAYADLPSMQTKPQPPSIIRLIRPSKKRSRRSSTTRH